MFRMFYTVVVFIKFIKSVIEIGGFLPFDKSFLRSEKNYERITDTIVAILLMCYWLMLWIRMIFYLFFCVCFLWECWCWLLWGFLGFIVFAIILAKVV